MQNPTARKSLWLTLIVLAGNAGVEKAAANAGMPIQFLSLQVVWMQHKNKRMFNLSQY
jgi:catalase (peroxidase I)